MTDDDKKLGVIMTTGSSKMRFLEELAGLSHSSCPITDQVTTPPVVSGPHGKAWLCDLAAVRERLEVNAADDACLAHWIIEAPWAHPAWHSYSLVLVHLRPISGMKTLVYLADATHELWLFALDPHVDRNKILQYAPSNCWLQPVNFAAQFIEINDDLAKQRVQNAVQLVCDGKVSPDTDFTSQWEFLFGNNMMLDRPNRQPPKEE